MKQDYSEVDFFLGSNSAHGFVSHFAQLQNPYTGMYTYVLKGGPGTGKSSFMKHFAQELGSEEPLLERIHCSSDPDSLDGVILTERKLAVVDGTPPHAMEPKYPLAQEQVVNLLEYGDAAAVKRHKSEIVSVSGAIAGFHKRFCELLACANMLFDSNRGIILPFVDVEKIKKTAERIARKEFKRRSVQPGEEKARQLSAFTPKGLVTYENTVKTLCKRVYFLHDDYRVCAPLLLEFLRQELAERDFSFYTCYSPFKPDEEIDALLIPECGLAFVTVNRMVPMESIQPDKVINATRFIDSEIFRVKKQRLSFYKKTAAEVLDEGIAMLEKAKEAHDELESFYVPNMDFAGLTAKADEVILQLKQTVL